MRPSRERLCVAPPRSSSNNQPIHTFRSGMNQPSMDRGDLALVTGHSRPRQPGGRGSHARCRALRHHQAAGRARSPPGPAPVRAHHAPAAASRPKARRSACMRETLLDGFRRARKRAGRTPERADAAPSASPRHSASAGAGSDRRWRTFRQRHPALQIELMLTEQLPDLGAEGYDGAVWLWAVQQRHAADWVSRRIARNQRVLAASPGYLKRRGTPADRRGTGFARLPGRPRERRCQPAPVRALDPAP